jgi:hypothetical protein
MKSLSMWPPGDYVVRIRHPQLAGDERATATTLKPNFRIRRASVPGRSGY